VTIWGESARKDCAFKVATALAMTVHVSSLVLYASQVPLENGHTILNGCIGGVKDQDAISAACVNSPRLTAT
jgi:hypothetical protein